MKKLWLISALSLGLVVLSWCNNVNQHSVEVKSSDDMVSMYSESNALTCNLSYSEWEGEGTSVMYIKDGMISQVTKSNDNGEDMVMYTLAKDGKMYVWWNVYGEWVWMSASYDVNLEEEFKWFDEVAEDTKVSCAKWVKDNSVFDLPKDVEFTSMDEWLDYDYDYEDWELDEMWNYDGEVWEGNEITEDNWDIVESEAENNDQEVADVEG